MRRASLFLGLLSLACSATPPPAQTAEGVSASDAHPSECTAPGPAQALLARYAAVVESSAARHDSDRSPSDMPREAWEHVAPAVRDVLLPERELLRRQAAWELQQLPLAKLPDLHGWTNPDSPPVLDAKQLVQSALLETVDEKDWKLAALLLAWSPERVFDWTRMYVRGRSLGVEESAYVTLLEHLAPPLVARLNDDFERPSLALLKANEVFAVDFAYDAALGAYLPQAITWRVRKLGSNAPSN
jgi:hypothetical protein